MDEIVFWYLNGARGSGTVTVPSTAQAGEWKLTVLCNRSPDTRATVSLILEAGEEEESLTPVVTLEDCEQTYTAMPLSAPEAKVTRPDGTALELDVTYVYYQDADCRMELSGAPTAVGTYYVNGFTEASDGLTAAESAPARIKILPAVPVIHLADQTVSYTGKSVIVDKAQVTLVGSDVYEGSVVYRYYQDAGCRMELSGVPEEPGIYYVKAFVEAHGNYAAAESDPARLEVMAGEEEEKPGESGGEPEQPDSGGQTPSDGGIVSETGGQMASRPEETPGEAMSDLPFADVPADAWYYEAIAYICGKGMMNGVAETRFAPQAELTRGMIVTILYRLETDPTYSTALFPDVPVDAYYTNATAWASGNGIVTGYDDGTFRPEDSITREQLATILYRYAVYKGYDVTESGDLSGYTDADCISAYAKDAMAWANSEGLITGVTDTTLNPKGTATRAQVATVLMRFCENAAK